MTACFTSAKEIITKSGKYIPEIYTGDVNAWKKLLERKGGLDGVIIATPWEWHKPMIMGSLNAGVKYVGTEVILGITLQDHWDMVKAAEKYNAHVMMLENVCYRRDAMAVLFNHQWVRDAKGQWTELNKARFTGDNTAVKEYRLDYSGGLMNN